MKLDLVGPVCEVTGTKRAADGGRPVAVRALADYHARAQALRRMDELAVQRPKAVRGIFLSAGDDVFFVAPADMAGAIWRDGAELCDALVSMLRGVG